MKFSQFFVQNFAKIWEIFGLKFRENVKFVFGPHYRFANILLDKFSQENNPAMSQYNVGFPPTCRNPRLRLGWAFQFYEVPIFSIKISLFFTQISFELAEHYFYHSQGCLFAQLIKKKSILKSIFFVQKKCIFWEKVHVTNWCVYFDNRSN